MMICSNYNANVAISKLQVEKVYIHQTGNMWSYSHHPSITFFKGRFYAIWSNGRKHEDYPGQRIMISSSEDFYHWTSPKPLVDSKMGEYDELVLTASGFHLHDDTLTVYYGQFEYTPGSYDKAADVRIKNSHMGTALYTLTSHDGENWNGPVNIGIPIVPNHGPQKTASGRLIISGNTMYPYTDDPTGLTSWVKTGIYTGGWDGVYDDSETHEILSSIMGWGTCLCEGSFFQTDDGIIHMLLRSDMKKLWLTESYDDGTTWSKPVEADFTNDNTKFHFGRLPDGRYYYVGSPDINGFKRCPLVLSLSEDGCKFDRHFIIADTVYYQRIEGRNKGGVYGYPHTIIEGRDLYIICSICKEDVAVFKVPNIISL